MKNTVETNAAKDRQDWTFLGLPLGSASGWDEGDFMSFTLYDFEPAPGCNVTPGTYDVNYDKGQFIQYDDEGEETATFDMIDIAVAFKTFQAANK